MIKFHAYLRQQGLRYTRQRSRIAEIFLACDGHLSAEKLHARLHAEHIDVGQATVYRTLKHLCSAGLARELNFDDGTARYENYHDGQHHDHLICEICQRQIEVLDDDIERLQVALAQKHGFIPTRHRLNLYGICPECRKQSKL
jgi:Fur family ferric uptake transcriptional regulator